MEIFEAASFEEEDLAILITFVESNPSIKLKPNKNTKKKLELLFKDLENKLSKKYSVAALKLKLDEVEEEKKREIVQFEEGVISFYQENPVLYNYELDQFKEQNAKNRLIKLLAAKMVLGSDPPSEEEWTEENLAEIERKANDIKVTWNALKAKYGRKKKRHGNSVGTGKGKGEVYVSAWVHFENLMFLDDVGEIPTSNDIESDDQLDSPKETKRGRYKRMTKSEQLKEKRRDERWDKLLTAINSGSEIDMEKQMHLQNPYDDQWTSSIGKSIAKMRPLNQELAKAEIQKVIAGFMKHECLNLPPPEYQLVSHQTFLPQHMYSSTVGSGYATAFQYGNGSRWNSSTSSQPNGEATTPMSSPYTGHFQPVRRELGSQFNTSSLESVHTNV